MNLDQLRALRAIADEGSFEAAADELRISPSAVSQRIRALEREVGQPVVRRGTPCAPICAKCLASTSSPRSSACERRRLGINSLNASSACSSLAGFDNVDTYPSTA